MMFFTHFRLDREHRRSAPRDPTTDHVAPARVSAPRKRAGVSSDLLFDLLDLVRDAIIVRDSDDVVVFWNRAAEALYGWSRPEALGRTAHELLRTRLPDDWSIVNQQFRRDGHWEGLVRQVTRAGRELVVASRWSARRTANTDDASDELVLETHRVEAPPSRSATPARARAVELEQHLVDTKVLVEELEQSARDLRERTAVAEAAERQLTLVLESLPDAATLLDTEWRMVYVNASGAAAFRAAGYDAETLIGGVIWDAIPQLFGTRTHTEALRAVAEHSPVCFEERWALDGRWYETRIVPASVGVAVFLHDVSDRYRADAERAQLATIVETSDDAIISNSLDGTILSWNEGATRLFGYDAPEAIGRSIQIIVPASQHDEEAGLLARLRRGQRTTQGETKRRRKDGSPVDVSLSISPIHDRSGAITSVAMIARDVTAQRRADEQLARMYDGERTARAAAEAANRAKVEFLATMSHELRTPLNAISGYVELIEIGLHGPITAEQREDLSRIQRSQQHLLGLINDVLNFVRLDAHQVHFEMGQVDLSDACRGLEALILLQLQAKGLHYASLACDSGLSVRADAEKLRQILVNLLTNAIKFTDAGGHIDLRCEADEATVRIIVSDSGVGIPAERLTDIFEPFVQIGRQLNRPTEGVGLGLAISRELARAMHGDLTVESDLGMGSTFTLALARSDNGAVTHAH